MSYTVVVTCETETLAQEIADALYGYSGRRFSFSVFVNAGEPGGFEVRSNSDLGDARSIDMARAFAAGYLAKALAPPR